MKKTSLEKLASKIYRTPEPPAILGQKYAYVYAITAKGRHIFDGPYSLAIGMDTAPLEAEEFLARYPNGEIFVLKTRDKSRAKQEVKHKLAARGEDPDEVLKRMFKPREDETVHKKKRRYLFPKF